MPLTTIGPGVICSRNNGKGSIERAIFSVATAIGETTAVTVGVTVAVTVAVTVG